MPKEAVIRRTIREAMDCSDFSASALTYLQKLVEQPNASRSFFTRVLPVISVYVNLTTPCDTTEEGFLSTDLAVIIVLGMLVTGMLRENDEEEVNRVHPVYDFIATEIDNIIRWLSHLFTFWVLESTESFAILNKVNSSREPELRAYAVRNKIISLAQVMPVMVNHLKIFKLVEDNAPFGTLLSKLAMAIFRFKKHKLLHQPMAMITSLLLYWKSGASWETSFIANLEAHAHEFAQYTVSLLKDYAYDPPLVEDPEKKLSRLLSLLVFCFKDHDIILDAYMEQDGTVRAFTSIFRHIVDDQVKERKATQTPATEHVLLSSIQSLASIFSLCFLRGGPPTVSIAIEEGFLDRYMSLYNIINVNQLLDTSTDSFESKLREPIDKIVPLVVYPSVFWTIPASFFRKYSELDGPPGLTKLPGLHEALAQLSRRLRVEVLVVTEDIGPIRKPSLYHYSRLYKFCDNCQRSIGSTKLGWCSSCQAAYYCSRRCQRDGWVNGHRQECKQITSSHRGGREGFPPVVTIHDREYFKRTLPYRFHFYAEEQWSDKPPATHGYVADMDFTGPGVSLRYTQSQKDVHDGSAECGQASDGLLVRASFSTCGKLGYDLEVSVAGVRYPNLDIWECVEIDEE